MSQDFTSTKQIYEYLIAGGKVKYEYLSGFVFLDNNGMTNRDHAFDKPEHWSKYIEPKPKIKLYLYDYFLPISKSWNRTTEYLKDDISCAKKLGFGVTFKRRDEDFIEVDSE